MKNKKRKEQRSSIIKYCVTTVACLLLFCVAYIYLIFGTDVVINVDDQSSYNPANFDRISVQHIISDVEDDDPGINDPDDGSGDNGGGSGGNPPPGVPAQPSPILNGDTFDFTNCPYDSFCYTYMAWQLVTSKSSAQYQWRDKHFPSWVNTKTGGDPNAFNTEGFGIVNGRYVIATTHKNDGGFAEVGQALDVYLEDGTILYCVVGDIKSSGDPDWTPWGHIKGTSANTIEFIVDYNSWYNVGHANPGTAGCHPEWKQKITKIVVGNII